MSACKDCGRERGEFGISYPADLPLCLVGVGQQSYPETALVNCLRSQLAALKAERDRIAEAAAVLDPLWVQWHHPEAPTGLYPMFNRAVDALLDVARRKG